ncbi:MAG: hypothetical protein HDR82_06645 [Bacteroides sp.]|nr:hypothetical protein [Bacteroides sp.]
MNNFGELLIKCPKKAFKWCAWVACGVLVIVGASFTMLYPALLMDVYWSGPKVIDLEDTNMQIIYGVSQNHDTEICFVNKLEQDTAKIRFKIKGISAPQFFYIAGCDTIYILDRWNLVTEVNSGNFQMNIIDTSNFEAIHKGHAITDSLSATGKRYLIDCESRYIPYIVNPKGEVISKDKLLISH